MIDWDGELEWSNGDPCFKAYLPGSLETKDVRFVVGCQEWQDDTGDRYVAVNARTGRILGCETTYPFVRNRKPPASSETSA